MKSQTNKVKKKMGLKPGMVAVILLCWVVPMLLIVFFGGVYVIESQSKQAVNDIIGSAETTVESAKRLLDSAVSSSRSASYIPTVSDAWRSYLKTGNQVELFSTVNTFLDNHYKYDEKLKSTYITFTSMPESVAYTYSNNADYSNILNFQQNIKSKILDISENLDTGVDFLVYGDNLYLIRNLLDGKYHPYAVIVMELNKEVIFENIVHTLWATDITLWINNTQLTVLGEERESAHLYSQIDNKMEYIAQDSDGPALIGYTNLTTGSKLKYVMYFNMYSVNDQIKGTQVTLLALIVILIPLIFIVMYYLYRKVNHPIDQLITASAKIENGGFGIQVDADKMGSMDFCALGESFNSMSYTLKNQFERIYKEELALKDARIMALQSQINPHFLNNTLEIINWEARLSDDVKVCKMLEALSTMLNAAMDRKNKPVIHLSEELMYVDSYLLIIRERLGRRLQIEKEIDKDTLDAYVPRLILQPIIENAVEHGIAPTQRGTIIIRSYIKDNLLTLEVENDGLAKKEDLDRISALLSNKPISGDIGSGSLGIKNVHERLKMLYGDKSGLSIDISPKGTTISKIVIYSEVSEQ